MCRQADDEMKTVAQAEGRPLSSYSGDGCRQDSDSVAPYRYTKPVGIGKGLRTKVNASI